jgi:hypothetical protein
MDCLEGNCVVNVTKYDMDYRPETYWPPVADRLRWQISRIKGEARRRAALSALAKGGPAALESWMVAHDLGAELKDAVQMLHPGLRGGEDLPDLLRREVEIARIWFAQTVHREVTSIRARPGGARIRYRVVDEYCEDGDEAFVISPRDTHHPLTLAQLIHLIDTATIPGDPDEQPGLVVPWWDDWMRFDSDPEAQRGSIAVSSEFYPQLSAWYDDVFEEWCRRKSGELAEARPALVAVN